MPHPRIRQWISAIRRRFFDYLDQDQPKYRQRIINDMDRLYASIRKGDLVLVDGRSKMSGIIKLFSSSHWSHVGLYVGDASIAEASANAYRQTHGDPARHLLVEAFSGEGVIVSPLEKYRNFNIRICRPYGIADEDRDAVVDDVISNIGRRYDDQNIYEIAWLVLSSILRPNDRRSHRARLGSGNDYQVICSGMIANAFQKVGYPIIPALNPLPADQRDPCKNPYGAKLMMRHFSQILPRDFDLSPNFEVIKFNIIGQPFDYRELWQEKLKQ